MSIYAQFDDGEQRHLASNTGWGDIVEWSESLDPAEYPDLIHLCDHGYEQQLDALEQQIHAAVAANPPPDDVRKTLSGLLDTLAVRGGADVLFVTDGMTSDDGEENAPPPEASNA